MDRRRHTTDSNLCWRLLTNKAEVFAPLCTTDLQACL